MRGRLLVPLVIVVLAIGTTRPAIALGERPNVSPFDGGVTVPRPLSASKSTISDAVPVL